MDLLDYLDGKALIGTQWAITVGAADAVLIPGGNHRVSILVSNNSASNIFLSFGSPANASNGIKIPTGQIPVQFDRRNWGNLLDNDLHFVGTAGGLACTVLISYLKV